MKIRQSMTINIKEQGSENVVYVSVNEDNPIFLDIIHMEMDLGHKTVFPPLSVEQALSLSGAINKVCKHILEEEAKG